MLILVTGGARSGKSAFAERYAAHLGGEGLYIATARSFDGEMEERIGRHRRQREESGFIWTTVEEPYELAARIGKLDVEFAGSATAGGKPPVILVDCLTLWLSNWLLRAEREDAGDAGRKAAGQIGRLTEVLERCGLTVLLVTNEVGQGVVPEYPLGRLFRDLSGRMNQQLAAVCGQVFLVTAGIPLELKSRAFRMEEA